MKTETTLQNIKKLLFQYNAITYATEILRKKSDEELYDVYSVSNDEPINKVKDRAYAAYLERYAENAMALAGFYKMGQVFVLDKREGLIYFVANENREKGTARLVVNYNPLGVDCFEMSISADKLFQWSDRFEFSLDEEQLMEELKDLI